MAEAVQLARSELGVSESCSALGLTRSTYYRLTQPKRIVEPVPRKLPSWALSPSERQSVLEVLNEERFVDQAPAAVYHALLDEGRRLCSPRTMYRVLADHKQVRERRNQLRHPEYRKPELLATAPNQVWSWDITKLRGPVKWLYYYLYVILDVYSRYAVGWILARSESGSIARHLIDETCAKQNIQRDQLYLHSDRGPSMKSYPVAQLLATLGVTKSHSRPHTSNDNPYSESQFKTLKYRPDFPRRFDGFEHARTFSTSFFTWYNNSHYHSGLAYLTPAIVHYGHGPDVLAARHRAELEAFHACPERFRNRPPVLRTLPEGVWINPPAEPVCDNYTN